MSFKNKQTLLFIGDSITDCGRRDADRPLGRGFVKMFSDLLILREPTKQFRVINKGIGGDTATGLRNRWDDDVLRHKPDWLFIKVGINDLHRVLRNSEDQVPPELYQEAYEDILKRTKASLPKCSIILIDPFFISQETSPNSFRHDVLQLLPKYIKVVSKLSTKYQTHHLKTHVIFQRLLKTHESEVFCPEPVHPNATGHIIIAESLHKLLQ
ncbi:MAG: SGNH/GDSL hydrolase family protein [Opitutaceae bacterium]|nr:SGNH/GDSL hydrolase family protein [Opitutaceae bacterium]